MQLSFQLAIVGTGGGDIKGLEVEVDDFEMTDVGEEEEVQRSVQSLTNYN